MTKIISFLVVLCAFFSCAHAQEKTIRLQDEFEKILDESVSYNRDLISSLQKIKDKKTAEQAIPVFISLNQKAYQVHKNSKEFKETLKKNNINLEEIKNYQLIMSRYRLLVLPQIYQVIEARDRLNKNDWYGLEPEVKNKVQQLIYIAHSYNDPDVKHKDTIHRLHELIQKSEKEAHSIIDIFKLISNKESADQQSDVIHRLFDDLYKNLIIINMYILDDYEGSKNEILYIHNTFLVINEEFDIEISRLMGSDYYESLSLEKYIRSIGYPIMRINIPSVNTSEI